MDSEKEARLDLGCVASGVWRRLARLRESFLMNQRVWRRLGMVGWALCFPVGSWGGAAPGVVGVSGERVVHRLVADAWWLLNFPTGYRQFDASALLRFGDGRLWTLSDRSAAVFEIELGEEGRHEAGLKRVTGVFTPEQLQPFAAEKKGRYDAEGLAQDAQGRVYLCEEANRWILRYDRERGAVERLAIDWAPVAKYFHRADPNASFEGVAVGGGRLYVANERSRGRVIVVDLQTLRVVDDFAPRPAEAPALETTYSDLCWFEGCLFVLLREARRVLAVDPATKEVRVDYDFRALEEGEFRYRSLLPFGNMEGLAVDREFIWLVTDNNGQGRVKHPEDIRPMLFRCRRKGGAADAGVGAGR